MKRLHHIFFIVLAVFFLAAPLAKAAGTVTVTQHYLSLDKKVLVIKLDCTGDESDGSVPETAIDADDVSQGIGSDYYRAGFYLYDMWVIAGDTAPDAANIAITDSYSRALYPDTEIIPTSGTAEADVDLSAVVAPITVTQTAQATASAEWAVYILLAR